MSIYEAPAPLALPFWVDRHDITTAAQALAAFRDASTLLPGARATVAQVLSELSAALVREAVYPDVVRNGRIANGVGDDRLPILMNESEADMLKTVPGLPLSFTTALTRR